MKRRMKMEGEGRAKEKCEPGKMNVCWHPIFQRRWKREGVNKKRVGRGEEWAGVEEKEWGRGRKQTQWQGNKRWRVRTRGIGESLIQLISGMGHVADAGDLSLLPSKNNIGIGRLWSEKSGDSRGRGNYSGPINTQPSLNIHTGNWDWGAKLLGERQRDGQPAQLTVWTCTRQQERSSGTFEDFVAFQGGVSRKDCCWLVDCTVTRVALHSLNKDVLI